MSLMLPLNRPKWLKIMHPSLLSFLCLFIQNSDRSDCDDMVLFIFPLFAQICWERDAHLLGGAIDRLAVASGLAIDVTIGMAVGLGLGDGSVLRLILILRTVIIKFILEGESVRNANNVEQPKEVESLKGREQSRGDDLAQAALVLLRLPVQLKGTNRLKLGQKRPDDLQVDDMTEVDPNTHEEDKVRTGEGVIEVVESLGGGEEEVTNVVGDVDGQADVGEVEAVAETDESQTDNVVTDELLEVLAGLLHAKDEDDGLLSPVCGLEEVVKLDGGRVCAMREAFVHASSVKVPDRSRAHDPEAKGAENAKVDGGVNLLHESSLLAAAQASAAG